MNRWTRNLLLALLLTGVAGCATTNGGDERDPAEGFNRAMYAFNDGFDQAIGKPVATTYRDVVPDPARMMVRNFFGNLADPWIGANNLLQGKPLDAMTDWMRFAINTVFGVFGLVDFASEMGIEKHDEDFGQTMGRWGMGDGAYIVWPFVGSSTVRDSVGLIPDYTFDPVWNHKPHGVRYFMVGLRAFGKRADLLDASRILEEAALDKYVFQRDAHLQRRRSLIYDGNPPRAAREVPRAEVPASATPEPAAASGQGGSIAAAVRLLEQPASSAAGSGG